MLKSCFKRLAASIIMVTLFLPVSCSAQNQHSSAGLEPKLCAGLSDKSIRDVVGYDVEAGYVNSLGCSWSVMGRPGAIEFSVYRDSNYLKEMRYDKNGHGTVKLVSYGKRKGLMSVTGDGSVCELIMPQGPDFIVWTIEQIAPDQNACDIGQVLMSKSSLT